MRLHVNVPSADVRTALTVADTTGSPRGVSCSLLQQATALLFSVVFALAQPVKNED